MKKPLVTWSTVPSWERVTVAFLAGCVGAADADWMKRQVDNLNDEHRLCRCAAAVQWGERADMPFAPCGNAPMQGQLLCSKHGGATRHHARKLRRLGQSIEARQNVIDRARVEMVSLSVERDQVALDYNAVARTR